MLVIIEVTVGTFLEIFTEISLEFEEENNNINILNLTFKSDLGNILTTNNNRVQVEKSLLTRYFVCVAVRTFLVTAVLVIIKLSFSSTSFLLYYSKYSRRVIFFDNSL
jgi:hypothetical protein